MFQDDKPVHIRELYWLAHYYEMHGNEDKAREILATIAQNHNGTADHGGNNVVDIFGDEKKEA